MNPSNEQTSAPVVSPAVSSTLAKDPKKNNSLRGRQSTTIPTAPRGNGAPATTTPQSDQVSASNPEKPNDTTTRNAQDLSALFDTSLIRVVFRNKQTDKTVIRDLFVQLVREIIAGGASRKKPKFRYSRCDSEGVPFSVVLFVQFYFYFYSISFSYISSFFLDLQFVTDTTVREADSETSPPSIKAASFPRLIERATYEKHPSRIPILFSFSFFSVVILSFIFFFYANFVFFIYIT